MKFYLSSYRIGNRGVDLMRLVDNQKIAYIPNAIDSAPENVIERNQKRNLDDLTDLGFEVEIVDLKDYFGKEKELVEKLNNFKVVWVAGGNTFVLRQAMKLSGFDKYLLGKLNDDDFLYAGYSAGVCVLAPALDGLKIVDNPNDFFYQGVNDVIWSGLNILDYLILPHYKSDHPESVFIDKEVEYCEKNNIKYKTLRDGDVIIIE